MSEIIKKAYINKKDKGAGEYEDLYLEGVELLQKLSGAKWTDYNEHDPGVTILENIAYTMTGLSYKANLHIKDILTESKGEKLVSGDNGFFIPSEILTTTPITLNDFRKVFISNIKNVKNVWIKPQDGSHFDPKKNKQKNLNGLYEMFVEMTHYDKDPTKLSNEKEKITTEIQSLFQANRNLGEDLYKITILDPFELRMKLHLTMERNADGEELLANIYYKINDYLAHQIKFHSLWELDEEKRNINSIFNGPYLKNGFIQDSELFEKRDFIKFSEVLRLIISEEDVISVEYLNLTYIKNGIEQPAIFVKDKFLIPENTTPVLVLPKTKESLVIRDGEIEFNPDIHLLRNQYSYIVAKSHGSFRSVSQFQNTIKIPGGTNLGISSYYPIREQFPALYGIGHYGLPDKLPTSRYAQANQLKAYLLPFDQLLKNFLAQLTSIYAIYDPKSSDIQSYFYKNLEDMPNLVELIKSNEDVEGKDEIEQWKKTLESLNAQFDTRAIERLSQVADNLLARFSEVFPVNALRKIHMDSYGKQQQNPDFEKDLLQYKRKFITNYGELSYNRSKGYDHTQHFDRNKDSKVGLERNKVPAIVQKAGILMGIHNFEMRSLSKVIYDSGIRVIPKKDEDSRSQEEFVEISYSQEKIDLEEIDISERKEVRLRDTFNYEGYSGTIFNNVFKKGVLEENYHIEQSKKKKNSYYIKYAKSEDENTIVHISNSEAEAKLVVKNTIEGLIEISKKSEGIHLIEHLLLAPPYHGNHFGFTFIIQLENNRTFLFKQKELKPYAMRNRCIQQIMDGLSIEKALTIDQKKVQDGYILRLLSKKDGDVLAVSELICDNDAQAKKDLDILNALSFSGFLGEYFKKSRYYCYYGNKKVNEEFFSFNLSFILPSWPARFQHKGFKTKFDTILYEHTPAHIAFHSYWLDLPDLYEFEKDYFDWLNAFSKDEKKMELAYRLIKKLKLYHKYYHN